MGQTYLGLGRRRRRKNRQGAGRMDRFWQKSGQGEREEPSPSPSLEESKPYEGSGREGRPVPTSAARKSLRAVRRSRSRRASKLTKQAARAERAPGTRNGLQRPPAEAQERNPISVAAEVKLLGSSKKAPTTKSRRISEEVPPGESPNWRDQSASRRPKGADASKRLASRSRKKPPRGAASGGGGGKTAGRHRTPP